MSFGMGRLGRGFGRLGASSKKGTSGGIGSPYTMAANSGTFVLSGDAMTPLVDRILPADVAAFALTGQAATLTYVPSAYTGPGDIVSGAATWASPARAYTAAFAATAGSIMDLQDQAGANPITINVLTTGFVDVTAISNWVSANSVSTIKVTKLYDQTGNANHWTQATLANMPTLTLSALNSLPGITCASASAQRLDTPQTLTPTSSAGPMTFSAVAKRTANFTTAQSIIGCQPAQAIGIGFSTAASTIGLRFIGLAPTLGSVADSSFHAIQGVVSGASSVIAADGTSASGTATGSAPGANQGFRLGRDQGGNLPLDGQVMEIGVWMSTAFTTQNITDVNTNQHGTSGYNF